MPWTRADAKRFTRKAKSAKSQRQWSSVANSALSRGATEGSAVRQANAVVGKRKGGRTKMARRKGRKGRKRGRK